MTAPADQPDQPLAMPGAMGAARGRSVIPDSRVRTRERLIRHGTALLTEFSFDGTGIERLLREVGVPKGSFYHYFPSKQAFVLAVIDNYVAYFDRKFDRLLGNASRQPLQRLQDWVAEARMGMARHQFRRGCLVGNLAQELGAHDDRFRGRLEAVFQSWQGRVRGCLADAVAAGQLSADADPAMLAEFFWIGWEGALMRAKLTRDPGPIDRFARQFFAMLPAAGLSGDGAPGAGAPGAAPPRANPRGATLPSARARRPGR